MFVHLAWRRKIYAKYANKKNEKPFLKYAKFYAKFTQKCFAFVHQNFEWSTPRYRYIANINKIDLNVSAPNIVTVNEKWNKSGDKIISISIQGQGLEVGNFFNTSTVTAI